VIDSVGDIWSAQHERALGVVGHGSA